MNIKDAKQEIIHTIRAYTAKNAWGGYAIPPAHQRPLLLIGPPGIGKTAVMEQAAAACQVGFVSYTMTHHTRQSAIGLPFIRQKDFGGREYPVTEYTMSEIIASVYRCMEETHRKEGLLFLDEINCVSETLAPAMLQFLQNKTFGSHRLPEGWVLAAAGNPPDYNKSVREFDIATLDRLKYITVEADYEAWRPYALEAGIHGSILSYLDTHRSGFYVLEQTYSSKAFATARGWEDLSMLLGQYEALGLPVTQELVGQYLHVPELARDFYGCYRVFSARKDALPIPQLLRGDEKARRLCRGFLADSSLDERLLFVHLLLSCIGDSLQDYERERARRQSLLEALERLRRYQRQQKLPSLIDALPRFLEKEREILSVRREHGLSSDQELRDTGRTLHELQDLSFEYRARFPSAPPQNADFAADSSFFEEKLSQMEKALSRKAGSLRDMATCGARLLEEQDGPEFTLFLASLAQNPLAPSLLGPSQPDWLEPYRARLAFENREQALRDSLRQAGVGNSAPTPQP